MGGDVSTQAPGGGADAAPPDEPPVLLGRERSRLGRHDVARALPNGFVRAAEETRRRVPSRQFSHGELFDFPHVRAGRPPRAGQGASSLVVTLFVPTRPRSRLVRLFLEDFCRLAVVSLRPTTPRFQRPNSTPFNSASDAFRLRPDVASRGPSTLSTGWSSARSSR